MSPGGVDLWLIKLDSSGDTTWMKTYGSDWEDSGYWIEQTSDGGFIITGYSRATGTNISPYLLKTDENGDTIWTRYYGFVSSGRFVAETSDGYIIGVGVGLLKTDFDGDSVWSYHFPGKAVRTACATSDSGYVFVSSTWGSFGSRDVFMIKTDADGDSLWGHTWGGTEEDEVSSIYPTTDGGYILCGSTKSFGSGHYDGWLIKTDSLGDTLWTRTFGEPLSMEQFHSVQQLPNGGYIISGLFFPYAGEYGKAWLVRTDSLGYVGVEEPVTPVTLNWVVSASIGREIVIRYSNLSESTMLNVYDVLGRMVDVIETTGSSGHVTWGQNHRPGVYFIREATTSTTARVVIVQ